METLRFTCPRCGHHGRFKVDSVESVIIFNCPHCRTVLLASKGQLFSVRPDEVKTLIRHEGIKNVAQLLQALVGAQKKRGEIRPYKPSRLTLPRPVAGVKSSEIRPARSNPISHDDIVDLIIDINISQSVDEFLDKITPRL